MRFSTSLLLSIPAIVAAEGAFYDQYVAQFQNFLGSFGAKAPTGSEDGAPASAPIVDDKNMAIFTKDNWKDTLYAPVIEGATVPQEWWIFITGGNKTCGGYCGRAETAWNESVATMSKMENSPHFGLIDCEREGVLCSALMCGCGSVWVMDLLPQPAPVDIYRTRLNLSSVTADEIVKLQQSGNRDNFAVFSEGYFHPFNGIFAQNGLTIPLGYVGYAFSMVPNWLFMFVLSMGSRMLMSRRMQGMANNQPAGPGGAAPAAGAAQ